MCALEQELPQLYDGRVERSLQVKNLFINVKIICTLLKCLFSKESTKGHLHFATFGDGHLRAGQCGLFGRSDSDGNAFLRCHRRGKPQMNFLILARFLNLIFLFVATADCRGQDVGLDELGNARVRGHERFRRIVCSHYDQFPTVLCRGSARTPAGYACLDQRSEIHSSTFFDFLGNHFSRFYFPRLLKIIHCILRIRESFRSSCSAPAMSTL